MRKIIFGYIAMAAVLLLIFFGGRAYFFSRNYKQPMYKDDTDISYFARVDGKNFEIYTGDGSWEDSFLAGVDVGSGKPGFYPGDLAISEDEYFEWFQKIADMNANVIRIYIPQSPAFYKAFYEYNQAAATPLYLIQGIYVDENEVSKYMNVYASGSSLIHDFQQDIIDCINIIHGNAIILDKAGKASGAYTYDISEYVIGWILGIEWDPELVTGTNEANPDKTSFSGQYVYTRNASPFEVFLAETAELAIGYETEHYQMQRPVAIANWPTTDPLKHPNEPYYETEDAVSVDVEHIHATDSFKSGFYASYHVYPYYPDFMSFPEENVGSNYNPYKEYLDDLVDYHSMPVLISEFGVPTSRGQTHVNIITGLNQGFLSEKQQGDYIMSMLTDIRGTGCMGGIVFSWQDEWFKTAWNTMDFDLKSSRPYWLDVETSEQNFGLLSFDTSENVVIDGDDREWEKTEPISDNASGQLCIQYDEAYLYLLARVDDFKNCEYFIPIDTIGGEGSNIYDSSSFSRDADFVLVLSGENNSRLLIDPYYNPNYKLYGDLLFSEEELASYETNHSGEFIDIQQVISRALELPQTGQKIDKQMFTTGALRYGISDPGSSGYDSLADFYAGNGFVEIRIPWLLLNIADPSTSSILSNLHNSPDFTYEKINELWIGIGIDGEQSINMDPYSFTGWNSVSYHERLKQSYYTLQDNLNKFSTINYPNNISADEAQREKRIRLFYIRIDNKVQGLQLVIYLLFFTVTVFFYLFIWLIFLNAVLNRRMKTKQREQDKLRALCMRPADEARKKINTRYLRTMEGVNALYELLLENDIKQTKALKRIVPESLINYCLRTRYRKQEINQIIKVAAMLGMVGFEKYIIGFMIMNNNDADIQYGGFLALALLGRRDTFAIMCKRNDGFSRILSYRCLKEIFNSYNGDKHELLRELLECPDEYIRRICVKSIGDEHFTDFENALLPMLDTDHVNLLCDVVRALGQLGSEKAGDRISAYTSHDNWVLRNVAFIALSNINFDKYKDIVEQGLNDREWWVRYNSAMQICRSAYAEEILNKIKMKQDRFAIEILTYAISENKLIQEVN